MLNWLHTMDGEGITPLDRAFNTGHMALSEAILEQEKLDKSETLCGTTPLHRAACLGLTEAVASLLECGADANAFDEHHETPLHKAARNGHVEGVQLLAGFSNPNAPSRTGMTPLHWACLSGKTEVVDLLLRHGGDPCKKNDCLDVLSAVDMVQIMGYNQLEKFFGDRGLLV